MAYNLRPLVVSKQVIPQRNIKMLGPREKVTCSKWHSDLVTDQKLNNGCSDSMFMHTSETCCKYLKGPYELRFLNSSKC